VLKRLLNKIRNLKPIMIENSKVPVFLSHFAPIDIWAISFGPFVWCRGIMSPVTIRHERIHFAQQVECLFIGQWILYGWYWLRGVMAKKSGREAYYSNAFEEEAYTHENDPLYLENRPFYHWKKYI
tara:strand:- start:8409 stop:8786 length:378 start_codon:yes stop_codon:yes gene_type:complete